MLDRLFKYKVHPFLQFMGLAVLAIGLPMNKVLMSIGTIWLASNLVLKADLKGYWENWKSNWIFWFIVSLLVLHGLGLSYTSDFQYGFRDINTKLPLFVIPIAVIAFPIKKSWLTYIFYFYLASICITTSINLITDWSNPQADFRHVSLFGSHIRYTILVVTGVLVSLHLFQINYKLRLLWIIIIGWLLFYVYQSQVFSGYVSLLLLIIASILYSILVIRSKNVKYVLLTFAVLLVASTIFLGIRFFNSPPNQNDFSELPELTPRGNTYIHDTNFIWYENGNHVMSFIAEEELKKAWAERSSINYDAKDQNGHKVKSTLIRYMSSKGIRKDLDGMKEMSAKDIRNVEEGYTNINQLSRSPLSRIENLRNDINLFKRTGNPNGSSITERLEHYKIGKSIARDNWIVGVGTGDVQMTFNMYYEQTKSKLDKKNWNRAHNQFLTFWITFGVLGFSLFVLFWFYMLKMSIKNLSLLSLGFVFIAVGSFISEDTLETQQGVTFAAFFIALSYLSTYKGKANLK